MVLRIFSLTPWARIARLYRGRALLLSDKVHEALDEFNTIIETNPSDADALTFRGQAHAMLGDVSAAIKDYTIALQSDPAQPVAHFLRGASLINNGKFKEAEEDFDKIVDRESNQTTPLLPAEKAWLCHQDTY